MKDEQIEALKRFNDEQAKIVDEYVRKSNIAELKKIKDRLEVAMWYNRRDKEYCLELIDKRISELKGENK